MTSRLRTSNLEQESNFDEGVPDLAVEEKYAEVKTLIAIGKEKGFLLYDEIYEVLPEEITSLPEELDEIYIRFADLGIDVVEDAEKPLQPTTKGIVTIDGTIEEKEMDQREEVQQDIIAASSGIVDKTNDPVRMYLREMGTVKLLDRQGEVDIAKRIEKGERRVFKALSANRIIREEILKIYEAAKKDQRVIKETIDLAMPEDDGAIIVADENGEVKLPAAAVNKINEILSIFEKIVKLDKKIKDAQAKIADPKKLSQRALQNAHKNIDKLELDLATELRQIDFTPATRNRMINKLKDIDNELAQSASMIRKDDNALRREKDKSRREFYRRRLYEVPGQAQGARDVLRHRPHRSADDHPRDPGRRRGSGSGQAGADRREPPPRRLDREEVHQPRAAVPRPDPGREHRPDEGGREVRVPPRIQVLDVRDVVDSPGDHPRDRRPGAHHPHPGAHDRDDQQADAHVAFAGAGARPRATGRGDRPADGHAGGEGPQDHEDRAGADLPRDSDRRRGRLASWAISSRIAPRSPRSITSSSPI